MKAVQIKIRLSYFTAILALSGCNEQRPPAPTHEQSAQLNEAEDMLDAAANEEGPADRSAGPSNSSD